MVSYYQSTEQKVGGGRTALEVWSVKHQANRSLNCSDKSIKTPKESTSGVFGPPYLKAGR